MTVKKQIDISKLNEILKSTIDSIQNSKDEITEIINYSRAECKELEKELEMVQTELLEMIEIVEKIEKVNKKHRMILAKKSKEFNEFSEKQMQEAYDIANETRITLMFKRKEEKKLLEKRKEIEMRLKKTYELYNRAENINKQITVATEYLMGDTENISETVDKLTQRHYFAIKIIEAQEEERLRVSRDIHDGPAQSLANVILKAELCEKLFEVDKEKSKEELKNLKAIARSTLKDVRKTIYDLRPMSLDDLGLIPTLERYIDVVREESNIKIKLKSYGSFEGLGHAVKIVSFRVIQEALNNIRKHSQASFAQIIIEKSMLKLNISVFDDGVGFDFDDYRPEISNLSSGFGLVNIKERVELLNGKFHIESSINQGTKINISIPLDKEVDIDES